MNKKLWKNIFLSFGIVMVVAGLGALFVMLGKKWYAGLDRPSQWLPDAIIPVMWSVIYLIASIIIFDWLQKDKMSKGIFALFVVNGVLNVLWCLLFFTLKRTFLGMVVIVVNLVFATCLLLEIKEYSRKYFYSLALYPIWLAIATGLNLVILTLN